MTINGINFKYHKLKKIPTWSTAVQIVANAIDGYPPLADQTMLIPNFLESQVVIQTKQGAGEWSLLLYAVESADDTRFTYPYGQENGYRQLRGRNGKRVKKLAEVSYMRWTYYKFTAETAPASVAAA